MCDNTNDFSGVKVGDKLWSVQLGKCYVSALFAPETMDYIQCTCVNNGAKLNYWRDGNKEGNDVCQSLFWSRPEIIAPPKPKRTVVKTVEMDVRVDRCGAVHRLRSGQGVPAGNHRVHLTGTYEVEE